MQVRRSPLLLAGALVLTLGVTISPVPTAAAATPSTTATTDTAAEAAPADRRGCPQLELADRWYGDNGRRIQGVIDRRGRCGWSDRKAPRVKPYAVFDWDNTMIKNDISDQTIFWMLRNDRILQPRGRDWRSTSQYVPDRRRRRRAAIGLRPSRRTWHSPAHEHRHAVRRRDRLGPHRGDDHRR